MINIGILCGGKSTEHDISVLSMLQIKELLNEYNIYVLYLDKEGNLYLANNMTLDSFKNSNYSSLVRASFVNYGFSIKKKITLIDTMIILNHGINGEDGMAAALMEYYNINYIGSDMYASVIATDKAYTYQILKDYGINQVDKIIYTNKDYYNKKRSPYTPCIIKPARLGSSIGIEIAHSDDEFLDKVASSLIYDNKLVIEKLLTNYDEYNIALYKTDKIYCSNIAKVSFKKEFYTFNEKYVNNNKNKNYHYLKNKDLVKRIEDISKQVYEILDMNGIVRIDFMVQDDIIYLNEINNIPGGLSYYLFDDFNHVIDELIKYSIIKKKMIKDKLDGSILEISNIKK
ncbi:MAG: hypothetical protein ACI35W_03545 [Anaeroplasmataceae bacterium]